MKKIDYVLSDKDFFHYANGGQGAHAFGVIKGLLNNSAEVNVIVPKSSALKLSSEDHLNEFRYETPVTGINFLDKLLSVFKVFKYLEKSSSDIILIRKNIYFLIAYLMTFGLIINRSLASRLVWEVNGFSFEKHKGKKYLGGVYFFNVFLHKLMLKKSLKIYVVSAMLKNELLLGSCAKIPSKNVLLIRNGSPDPCETSQVEARRYKGRVHLIFIGVLQDYNDFESVILGVAAHNEKSEVPVLLHVVGYGKHEILIKDMASQHDFLRYYGQLDRTTYRTLPFLEEPTFGLIPLKDTEGVKFLSPIKAYEYAAMGLPVVASNNSQIESDESFVFNYESGDLESFIECISNLYDANSYTSLSKDALDFAKRNSWSSRMQSLLSSVEDEAKKNK